MTEVLKLLIEEGANVNDKNEDGDTPLHLVPTRTYGEEFVKLLLDAGADVNAKNKYGDTPLGDARYSGEEIRKLLRDAKTDINITDNEKHLTEEKRILRKGERKLQPIVTDRQDNLKPAQEPDVISVGKIKNLTKNEVLQKLGKPDSTDKWSKMERWYYGTSYIEFDNGIFVRCLEPRGREELKMRLEK